MLTTQVSEDANPRLYIVAHSNVKGVRSSNPSQPTVTREANRAITDPVAEIVQSSFAAAPSKSNRPT
jgi:hypothetical protein